jgi:hypothetical protein
MGFIRFQAFDFEKIGYSKSKKLQPMKTKTLAPQSEGEQRSVFRQAFKLLFNTSVQPGKMRNPTEQKNQSDVSASAGEADFCRRPKTDHLAHRD